MGRRDGNPGGARVISVYLADDPDRACLDAAQLIGKALAEAIRARGRASLAASGGRTPAAVWSYLAWQELDWGRVSVAQVDERVVAEDHPDRNLRGVRTGFGGLQAGLLPMPIDGTDYEPALTTIAGAPPVLDVVQLGMGADGHTASLFPGDTWPQGDFGGVGPHLGHARYTLGLSVINRARFRIFVVTGEDKADSLRRVLAGDLAMPASHVGRSSTVFCVDRAAMPL